MAKKDTLKSNLIKKKPVLQKKPVIREVEAQRVVSEIHETVVEKKEPEIETVRTSVDFRKPLYKAMKRMLLEREMTMREYLESLVEADISI